MNLNRLPSFGIIIFFILISIIGLSLIPRLSVQLSPNYNLPLLKIQFSWYNSSPRVVEQEVTSKLEAILSTMRGVTEISSYSTKNGGEVSIKLDKTTNIDYARFETAMLIRQIYNTFPLQVSYPVIVSDLPEEDMVTPLLTYSIVAPSTPYLIQKYAIEFIKPKLGFIDGVENIEIYGANASEWKIYYNLEKLQQYYLTKQDILKSINQHFKNDAIGTSDDKKSSQTIHVVIKNYSDTINWNEIVISKNDNKVIFLTEVATIKQSEQKATAYYRINGLNSINLLIFPTKNSNRIFVEEKIRTEINNLKKSLPEGYNILLVDSSNDFIKEELTKIGYRTFFTFLILLIFVLLATRKIKYILLIIISLLMNIAISFLFYYLLKIEIHLFSLAGITLSFGMLIDNTIIMIDHIRHQKNIKAFIALLASTLTTIGALTVVFFLDEKTKLNLVDFVYVLIINLSVSLIISLFLIPALIVKTNFANNVKRTMHLKYINKLKFKFLYIYAKTILFLRKHRYIAIFVLLFSFGTPIFMLPEKMTSETKLANLYNKTIGNDWININIRPIINKYLGGTMRLFALYVFENSYYTTPQKTMLYVNARMPKGTTIEQMNETMMIMEKLLSKYNEIKNFTTYIAGREYAQISISFIKDAEKSSFPHILKNQIINKAVNLDGVTWDIYGIGKGFDNYKGDGIPHYRIAMYGYNYTDLEKQIAQFTEKISQHPRVQKVGTATYKNIFNYSKPDYEFVLEADEQKLAINKLSKPMLFSQLNKYFEKQYYDIQLYINKELSYVNIISEESKFFDKWRILNQQCKINFKTFKLNDLAQITKLRTGEDIYKINQQYKRFVEWDYTGAEKFGDKHLNNVIYEMKKTMPVGYSIEKQEPYWYMINQKQNIPYWTIFIVIGIIYLICSIIFESLVQPFAVIFIIPVSFIGLFLTFYLFDYNFDQGGFAAMVLLCGITVNSAIYIINDYNNICKSKKINSFKNYIKAFNFKFFPIILTILSTIFGFIPFVYKGQNEVFWFALAAGTIGGLLFSLIGILFFLPVFIIRKKRTSDTAS